MRMSGLLRSLCAFALLFAISSMPVSHSAVAAGKSTGCLPGVLRQRLAQIRAKFGGVSVISTHRPGARIAGSGRRSLHSSCRAVDFHPRRGTYRAVAAWLKANHGGGVGTYSCGMRHIHIDNGPRVRFHHCVTASGRPVRSYSSRRRSRRYANRSRRSRARYARRSRARSRARVSRRRTTTRTVSRRPARQRQAAQRRFTSERYLTQLRRNGV